MELVVGAVGAAIGGAALPAGLTLFGTTISGAALGWIGGTMLYGATQKTKTVAPQIGDLRVYGSGYGQIIPWVAGSPRVAPATFLWASKRRAIANTTEVGKGGGQEYTSWTYEVDILFPLTENVIIGVSRVWLNGQLVYGGGVAKAGIWDEMRVYTGEPDQEADPTYEAAVGAGNAPAYRGRGTVMIVGLKLGESGQVPNLTFEIAAGKLQSDVMIAVNTPGTNGSSFPPSDESANELPYRLVGGVSAMDATGTIVDNSGGDRQYYNYSPGSENNGAKSTPAWDRDTDLTMEGQYKVLSDVDPGLPFYFFGAFNFQIYVGDASSPDQKYIALEVDSVTYVGSVHEPPNPEPPYPVPLNEEFTVGFFYTGATRSAVIKVNDQVALSVSGLTKTAAVWNQSQVYVAGSPVDLLQMRACRVTVGRNRNVPGYTTPAYPAKLEDDGGIAYGGPGAAVPIRDVVDMLMARPGLGSVEYDASALDDEDAPAVHAMYLSQLGSTRAALEVLASAYQLTWSKSDKLYFRLRGATPVGTWNYEDLGVSDGPGGSDNPLPIRIGNQLEQHAQVVASYNNMAADFNTSSAASDLLTTDQMSTTQVQLPLGLLPSEAKGIVDSMLLSQAAALTRFGPVRVPLTYAEYEPSDYVLIPDHTGRLHHVLLNKKTDMGISLEFEGVGFDPSAMVAAGLADDTDLGQQEVQQPSGTAWMALDLPMLRDADNSPGWYAVAGTDGNGSYWPGAGLYRSWDDVTYSLLSPVTQSGVFGDAETALGDWTGGNRVDPCNTVVVTVNGELSSSTFAAMLADLTINTCAVGLHGRWEVLRFITATFLGMVGNKRQYRLSRLFRGYRGTEWAMGLHDTDDRFVLLNTALMRLTSEAGQIGLPRYVKAVTSGLPLSSAAGEEFTDTGVVLEPFAPVDLHAARADNDDISLTWRRRTRTSYRFLSPGIEVPLGEVVEAYDIEVWNSDFSAQLNTYHATESAFTYTAAQQTDDYGAPGTVYLRIRQRSAVVGAGYALEETA